MAARTAASLAIAFFGIRRASEVAKLSVGDVQVGTEEGVVDLKVNRQKNDPFGLGQLPYLLAARSWPAPVDCGFDRRSKRIEITWLGLRDPPWLPAMDEFPTRYSCVLPEPSLVCA